MDKPTLIKKITENYKSGDPLKVEWAKTAAKDLLNSGGKVPEKYKVNNLTNQWAPGLGNDMLTKALNDFVARPTPKKSIYSPLETTKINGVEQFAAKNRFTNEGLYGEQGKLENTYAKAANLMKDAYSAFSTGKADEYFAKIRQASTFIRNNESDFQDVEEVEKFYELPGAAVIKKLQLDPEKLKSDYKKYLALPPEKRAIDPFRKTLAAIGAEYGSLGLQDNQFFNPEVKNTFLNNVNQRSAPGADKLITTEDSKYKYNVLESHALKLADNVISAAYGIADQPKIQKLDQINKFSKEAELKLAEAANAVKMLDAKYKPLITKTPQTKQEMESIKATYNEYKRLRGEAVKNYEEFEQYRKKLTFEGNQIQNELEDDEIEMQTGRNRFDNYYDYIARYPDEASDDFIRSKSGNNAPAFIQPLDWITGGEISRRYVSTVTNLAARSINSIRGLKTAFFKGDVLADAAWKADNLNRELSYYTGDVDAEGNKVLSNQIRWTDRNGESHIQLGAVVEEGIQQLKMMYGTGLITKGLAKGTSLLLKGAAKLGNAEKLGKALGMTDFTSRSVLNSRFGANLLTFPAVYVSTLGRTYYENMGKFSSKEETLNHAKMMSTIEALTESVVPDVKFLEGLSSPKLGKVLNKSDYARLKSMLTSGKSNKEVLKRFYSTLGVSAKNLFQEAIVEEELNYLAQGAYDAYKLKTEGEENYLRQNDKISWKGVEDTAIDSLLTMSLTTLVGGRNAYKNVSKTIGYDFTKPESLDYHRYNIATNANTFRKMIADDATLTPEQRSKAFKQIDEHEANFEKALLKVRKPSLSTLGPDEETAFLYFKALSDKSSLELKIAKDEASEEDKAKFETAEKTLALIDEENKDWSKMSNEEKDKTWFKALTNRILKTEDLGGLENSPTYQYNNLFAYKRSIETLYKDGQINIELYNKYLKHLDGIKKQIIENSQKNVKDNMARISELSEAQLALLQQDVVTAAIMMNNSELEGYELGESKGPMNKNQLIAEGQTTGNFYEVAYLDSRNREKTRRFKVLNGKLVDIETNVPAERMETIFNVTQLEAKRTQDTSMENRNEFLKENMISIAKAMEAVQKANNLPKDEAEVPPPVEADTADTTVTNPPTPENPPAPDPQPIPSGWDDILAIGNAVERKKAIDGFTADPATLPDRIKELEDHIASLQNPSKAKLTSLNSLLDGLKARLPKKENTKESQDPLTPEEITEARKELSLESIDAKNLVGRYYYDLPDDFDDPMEILLKSEEIYGDSVEEIQQKIEQKFAQETQGEKLEDKGEKSLSVEDELDALFSENFRPLGAFITISDEFDRKNKKNTDPYVAPINKFLNKNTKNLDDFGGKLMSFEKFLRDSGVDVEEVKRLINEYWDNPSKKAADDTYMALLGHLKGRMPTDAIKWLLAETQTFNEAITEVYGIEESRDKFELISLRSFMLVLTDENGELLKVDNDGNPSKDGVTYVTRNIPKANKDGYFYNVEVINPEAIKDQVKEVYRLQEVFKANSNFEMPVQNMKISGGFNADDYVQAAPTGKVTVQEETSPMLKLEQGKAYDEEGKKVFTKPLSEEHIEILALMLSSKGLSKEELKKQNEYINSIVYLSDDAKKQLRGKSVKTIKEALAPYHYRVTNSILKGRGVIMVKAVENGKVVDSHEIPYTKFMEDKWYTSTPKENIRNGNRKIYFELTYEDPASLTPEEEEVAPAPVVADAESDARQKAADAIYDERDKVLYATLNSKALDPNAVQSMRERADKTAVQFITTYDKIINDYQDKVDALFETPDSSIESKKAEIERRRQKEVISKLTDSGGYVSARKDGKKVTLLRNYKIYQKADDNGFVDAKFKVNIEIPGSLKGSGQNVNDAVFQSGKTLESHYFDTFKDAVLFIQEYTDNSKFKEINDKYNAELAALENKPAVESNEELPGLSAFNQSSGLSGMELEYSKTNAPVPVSVEEELEAISWFQASFLKKGIDLNFSFLEHPSAFATFVDTAITLYKGADTTMLYHEAWHRFTQHFLTKEQKDELYAALKTLISDKKYVKHERLTYEEALAEGFRSLMLSKGKVMTIPVRGQNLVINMETEKESVFTRIIKGIANLFKSMFTDVKTDKKVTARNLIRRYMREASMPVTFRTSDPTNSLFKELESSRVKYLDTKEGERVYFDYKSMYELTKGIDALFVQYFNQLPEFKEYEKAGRKVTFTSMANQKEAIRSAAGKMIYDAIKAHIADQANKVRSNKKKLEFKAVLDNFDTFVEKAQGFREIYSNSYKTNTQEQADNRQLTGEEFKLEIAETYETKLSQQELASEEIINLVKLIPATDKKGKLSKSPNWGLPYLSDFAENWLVLANNLTTMNYQEMYNKILEMSQGDYPRFKHLIDNLPHPDTTESMLLNTFNLKMQFEQVFNMPVVTEMITILSKNEDSQNLIVKFTEAGTSATREVTNEWKNAKDAVSYTDMFEGFETLDKLDSVKNMLEFLDRLGITFDDKKAVNKYLKGNEKGNFEKAVVRIYKHLSVLKSKGVKIDNPVEAIIRSYPKQKLKGEGNSIDYLANIEIATNDVRADDMILRADGERNWKFNQFNYLTKFTTALDTMTYEQIIDIYPNLDVAKHPGIINSPWFRTLFTVLPSGAIERNSNTALEFLKTGGLKSDILENVEGTVTVNLTSSDKLVMDFYSFATAGTEENVKFGDKSTAGAMNLIGADKISVQDKDRLLDVLFDQLIGEVVFIKHLKDVKDSKNVKVPSNSKQYKYTDPGKDQYAFFRGMLSKEMKEALLQADIQQVNGKWRMNNEALKAQVIQEFRDYFDKVVLTGSKKKKSFKAAVLAAFPQGAKEELITPEIYDKASDQKVRYSLDDTMLWYYMYSVSNRIDQFNLLYGDLRNYNNGSDVYKRLSAYSACHGKGTEVVMYDGRLKKVEDVVVGDLLMGPDSKPRKVLELYSGYDKLYKINQARGESYIVNSNHILSLKSRAVYETNRKMIKGVRHATGGSTLVQESGNLITIRVNEAVKKSSRYFTKFMGWKPGLINFEESKANLLVEPYYVGLWLGDGTQDQPEKITNIDKEVIEYLYDYANRLNLQVTSNEIQHKITCGLRSNRWNKGNTLLNNMKTIGLYKNKFIPDSYLYGTEEDRLQLLAGFIDSDGTYHPSNMYMISQTRKELAYQLLQLVRSLGFVANIKNKTRSKTNPTWRDAYIISISGSDLDRIPCKIERKKACSKQNDKDFLTTRISIEDYGYGEYYGFELTGDHLYLLRDFTVTHNTGKFPSVDPRDLAKVNAGGRKLENLELTSSAKDPNTVSVRNWTSKFNIVQFSNMAVNLPALDRDLPEDLKKAWSDYIGPNKGDKADASGAATLDFYRGINMLIGTWDSKQESAYNDQVAFVKAKKDYENDSSAKKAYEDAKARAKASYKELLVVFNPKKWQYAGSIYSTHTLAKHIDMRAFLKFAIMPLIPSNLEGTELEKLTSNMYKTGTDMYIFGSGSKMTIDQSEQSFEEWTKSEVADFNPTVLDLRHFKEQLPIENKMKSEGIFASQMRKLLSVGLYENGKPVSGRNVEAYKRYEKAVSNITSIVKEEIKDRMDTPEKLVTFLENEFEKSDMPEHVKDFLNFYKENGNIVNDLDISFQSYYLQSVLFSIVNNRLIKQKFPGGQFVQLPNAGYRKANFIENAENGNGDDLKFYETYNNGVRTREMEVKIAFSRKYEPLLNLPHPKDGRPIGDITRLNTAITDEKFIKEHGSKFTMIGCRIPVQGFSTIEVMRVAKFLDPIAGQVVIVPNGLTIKSGSDFDIDKLNIYEPNLDTDGNLIDLGIDQNTNVVDLRNTIKDRIQTLKTQSKELKGRIESMSEDFKATDDYVDILNQLANIENEYSLDDLMAKFNEGTEVENSNPKREELLAAKKASEKRGEDLLNEVDKIKKELAEISEDLAASKYHLRNMVSSEINTLIGAVSNIVLDPQNAVNLISMNELDYVVGAYEGLGIPVNKNDSTLDISETVDVLASNMVTQNNNSAKPALGIVAKANTLFALFLKSGMKVLKPSPTSLDQNEENGEVSLSNLQTKPYSGKSDQYKTHRGSLYIPKVLSEFISATVDVANDNRVGDPRFHFDNFVAPVYIYGIMRGTHLYDLTDMVSNPIVQDYINEYLRLDSISYQHYVNSLSLPEKKKASMLNKNMVTEEFVQGIVPRELWRFKKIGKKQVFSTMDTLANVIEVRFTPALALADFIMLREDSNKLTELSSATSWDTNTSKSFVEFEYSKHQLDLIKNDEFFDPEAVDKITYDSVISSLLISDFVNEKFSPLFSIIANPNFIHRVISLYNNTNRVPLDSFVRDYTNDFLTFLFQNNFVDEEGVKVYDDYINNADILGARNEYNLEAMVKELKAKVPALEDNAFLKALKFKKSRKSQYISPILKTANIDVDTMNLYHDELMKLLNSQYSTDPELNDEIMDIANLLVTATALFNGVNKTYASFVEILPTDIYTETLRKVIARGITKADFDLFEYRFVEVRASKHFKDLAALKESTPVDKINKYNYFYSEEEALSLLKSMEDSTDDVIIQVGVKTYTGMIEELEPNQIFVFGSNTEGRHGKGAAKLAREKFGAKNGKAHGLQGQSFAMITKDLTKSSHPSRTPAQIIFQIQRLYEQANLMPEKEFLVAYSAEGKNLNGYSAQEMADMFSSYVIPSNVVFEKGFSKLLSNTSKPSEPVNIYAGTGENAELSNFAKRPFRIDYGGSFTVFDSVEQAFQAAKIRYASDSDFNNALEEKILNTVNGAELKKLGRSIKNLSLSEWDENSSEIMKEFIKESFKQNPEALAKLLATGNAELTHIQDKGKWGKEFPKLLMEVRSELKSDPSTVIADKVYNMLTPEEQSKITKERIKELWDELPFELELEKFAEQIKCNL